MGFVSAFLVNSSYVFSDVGGELVARRGELGVYVQPEEDEDSQRRVLAETGQKKEVKRVFRWSGVRHSL